MRMIQKVVIELTDEEKNTLRRADEIITEIIDVLLDNKANGHTPWQEGMIAPQCFWDISKHIHQIEDEDLIP